MKFYFALFISKLVYVTLKLLRHCATSFPGYIALKICPDFLKFSKKYIKSNFINITGTNGKTTTSGLISHILKYNNRKTISNFEGANMLTGIVNTFAVNMFPFKIFDNAVIETDEAFLTKIYDFVKGDMLVITNLFGDQLDRYGDVNFTQKIINDAILKNNDLKLILNADDPMVSVLGKDRNTVYYGIEDVEFLTSYASENKKDNQLFLCDCGAKLEYSKQFLAHQGHYVCTECDFKRPVCKYLAKVKIYDDCIELSVTHDDVTDNFKANLLGLYNAYNVLAAICTGYENALSAEQIQNALISFKAAFGRSDVRLINGKNVLIQLIKNAAGANEVIKTIDLNSNIMIALNNTVSDGKDTSWLWETNFERFQNVKKPIYVSGMCAYDIATRLKYVGVPVEKIIIETDVKKALCDITCNSGNNEKITLLPSYTVMWSIDKH